MPRMNADRSAAGKPAPICACPLMNAFVSFIESRRRKLHGSVRTPGKERNPRWRAPDEDAYDELVSCDPLKPYSDRPCTSFRKKNKLLWQSQSHLGAI